MKDLNTIQEIWERCLFCPICQDAARSVDITVGPDGVMSLDEFSKDDHILRLDCTAKIHSKKYLLHYLINCLDNTFELCVDVKNNTGEPVDRSPRSYMFFYIQGNCPVCDCANTCSFDMELNLAQKRILSVGLERESIYLLKEPSKYHVIMAYDSNELIISRCDNDGADTGNPLYTSLMELDFSDSKKAVQKIKTIMVFS